MCELQCAVTVLVFSPYSHTFVWGYDKLICWLFCVCKQCCQFQCHNMTLKYNHLLYFQIVLNYGELRVIYQKLQQTIVSNRKCYRVKCEVQIFECQLTSGIKLVCKVIHLASRFNYFPHILTH